MFKKIELKGMIIFKLVSGEELIGEVQDYNDETIFVKRPLQIQLVRDPNGSPAKALMPFSMLAPEADFPFAKSSITTCIEAGIEVTKAWRQETSGLILATQLNG